MRKLLITSSLAVIIVCGVMFYALQYAGATSGAFPYTKHGGGTTDGNPPYPYPVNDGNGYGVDRAVNPDYNAYYNDQSSEAGQYKRGECTQCHEPHGSFGGAEPPPTGSSPQNYLLMKMVDSTQGGYAELCWYCHENFQNLGGSGSPIGKGRFSFYQGKTTYQASSHYNSTNFYWPGDGTADPIWPRKNRSGYATGNLGSCLNCHTPHGILEQSGSEYDTAAVPATEHLQANNPNVSVDRLIPRQLIAWEEALCETCHDADGPARTKTTSGSYDGGYMDIKTEIDKRTTMEGTIPMGSGHPVHDTTLAGTHDTEETIPLTTKHVECYDCHNPHAVKQPTMVQGDGDGGRVAGMKYIDISGVAHDPATGERQPYIYEVCLKCHGNSYNQVFAASNRFPDTVTNRSDGSAAMSTQQYTLTTSQSHFSNKRYEFDPTSHQYANYPGGDIGYNTAYHPVAAPGRNGTKALCIQLQTAFSLNCATDSAASTSLSNLTIQCTDCHNSEETGVATYGSSMSPVGPVTESNLRTTDIDSKYTGAKPVGPHGSKRRRILRGHYVTTNTYSGGYFNYNYWVNRMDLSTTPSKPKFELCFLCHQENCLIDGGGTCPGSPGTNFGGTSGNTWNANLHYYHLSTGAVCHDCHHNVHSNVEAQNTIYGNGVGALLPSDAHDNIYDGKINTHLLNFGPQATGQSSSKPRWYYDGSNFRCNLQCHGYTMSLCTYVHGSGGTTNQWCAGR